MEAIQSIWNTCISSAISKAKLSSTILSKEDVQIIVSKLELLLNMDVVDGMLKYKEALEEIISPISFMQKRLSTE